MQSQCYKSARRGDETRRVGGGALATPGEAEARRGRTSAKSPSGDLSPRRIRGRAEGANRIRRNIWNSICGVAAMLTCRALVHKSLVAPLSQEGMFCRASRTPRRAV